MKIRIILLSIVCVCITSKSFCQKKQQGKVDYLFTYHFRVLDSIANNSFIDNTLRCVESIQFMELNTKISSCTDGTYFGKMSFTVEDLKAWHNWYVVNKKKLCWNEKNKRIEIKEALH